MLLATKSYFKLILASWIVLHGTFRIVLLNSGRQDHSDLILGCVSYSVKTTANPGLVKLEDFPLSHG